MNTELKKTYLQPSLIYVFDTTHLPASLQQYLSWILQGPIYTYVTVSRMQSTPYTALNTSTFTLLKMPNKAHCDSASLISQLPLHPCDNHPQNNW